MVLYDPITKKQHTGGWGTTSDGSLRGSVYISTNPATHGRRLTTQNPLEPRGISTPILRMPAQQDIARSKVVEQVTIRIDRALDKRYPSYATTSDGGRATVKLYKPEVSARLQRDQKLIDLQRRTAGSLAETLYTKYEGVFFHAQMGGLNEATRRYEREAPAIIARFKAKYPDAFRDDTYLREAYESAYEGLRLRAAQGTPGQKGKLFGFIPIKVSQPVNLGVGVFLGAVTAGSLSYFGAAGGASASGGGAAGAVAPSAVPSVVQAGGFLADLGIRGAQAVNLASVGAIPGANVIGTAGALTSSNFAIGAAGGLVSVAPTFGPASVGGASLGLTVPTLAPSVSSPSLLTQATNFFTDKLDDITTWIKANPGQAAVAATGSAFTLKRVSESSDPFTALVNTVGGAIGVGPILPPPGGSPGGSPLTSWSGSGGGGGSGSGAFGRYGAQQAGLFSSWTTYVLLAAIGLIGFMLWRKG